MRNAIVALALFSFATKSHAAFTDFSDYTQPQTFAEGVTFQSNGLSFKAIDWRSTITNSVAIFAGQTGSVLYLGPGVEFLLPSNTQEVSFYYDDGSTSGIAVNGLEPIYPRRAGFSYLNGASLAGVNFAASTTISTLSYEVGTLTLRGPITSLRIAGLETTIDNVTVLIPEPTALALLFPAAVLIRVARRRPFCRN